MSQSASIAKVNPWHQRLADWLICNPTATNREASLHFKVTESWLSTVKNSDAFQDYFQEISKAVSASVFASVREKTLAVADQSLAKIQEQLDGPTVIPLGALVDIADMALKRTGHGEGKANGPAIQVNVGLVTKDQLEASRLKMRERKVLPLLGGAGEPAIITLNSTEEG